MEKIKECKANGLYIFEGRVSANSTYFENLDESKKFLIYANYFLKDILTIHEFVLTRHGWHMLVKIKRKSKIVEFWNSKVIDNDLTVGDLEVWQVVSEQVRLFLSTFVRVVNRRRGRTGVLVHSSYLRFSFESYGEAKSHIDKLRKQLLKLAQKSKKYRGRKNHWEIPKAQGNASIFLCSLHIDKVLEKAQKLLGRTVFKGSQDLVLLKMIHNTISLHKSFSKPNFALKSNQIKGIPL